MVILTDPFVPDYVGMSLPKEMADIVTISHDHKDHNNKDIVAGPAKRKDVFYIENEGEYEIGGIEISAIKSFHDGEKGAKRGKNLVVVIRMDGMTLCHLGDLGHKLSEGTIEKMGGVDILMLPVGGVYTLGFDDQMAMIKEMQPSIVIPMHYKTAKSPAAFAELITREDFLEKSKLQTMGEPVHKIKIDQSSLPEDTQVLIMNA